MKKAVKKDRKETVWSRQDKTMLKQRENVWEDRYRTKYEPKNRIRRDGE